jgi:hypothetical protein
MRLRYGSHLEREEKTNRTTLTVMNQRGAPEREQPIYFEGQHVAGSLVFRVTEKPAGGIQKVQDGQVSQLANILEHLGAIDKKTSIGTLQLAEAEWDQINGNPPAIWAEQRAWAERREKDTEGRRKYLDKAARRQLAKDKGDFLRIAEALPGAPLCWYRKQAFPALDNTGAPDVRSVN